MYTFRSPRSLLPALALCRFATAGNIGVFEAHSSSSATLSKRIPQAEYSVEIAAKVRLPSPKWRQKGYPTSLSGVGDDGSYVVNATFGKNQVLPLILDTGSSDIWVPQVGFQCFDLSDSSGPESDCEFGVLYDPSKSTSYAPYPNHNFNISYASLEFLTGTVGFEKVTVAGLTVPRQEFGLVNRAAWVGDGVSSGILGLASPKLTNVFDGTNPNADVIGDPDVYSPFFYNAVQDGLVKNPYFSIALNRGTFQQYLNSTYSSGLGTVAFGGAAAVPTLPGSSVTTPILNLTQPHKGRTGDTFYLVQIDEYKFPGSSKLSTSSNVTVLDSGTTLNYLPADVASTYAAAFEPAAYSDDDFGGYVAICKSKVPEFKVVIGGKALSISAADQLLPIGVNDSNGNPLCFLGTQNGASLENNTLYILGDVFLHNVVATFDIVATDVTLAQRVPY